MNKVVTINLNGRAYQLEEAAYSVLHAYLDKAEDALDDNPDKDEIIKDLEQAMAIKCDMYLHTHKSVLSLIEINAVIVEMGPVEESDTDHGATRAQTQAVPKQLYRLPEGEIIAGVCTGLGAFFDVDVAVVRLLFIVLTFITGGAFSVVYLLAWVFIPVAGTTAQKAHAHGSIPLTAQIVIDRAKQGYEQFRDSGQWQEWQMQWKNQSSEWKKMHDQHLQWRHARKQYKKHEDYQYTQQYQQHSGISELFGIGCATLAITFVCWFLYGHLSIAHNFFNALHAAYESFIYSLAQLTAR